MARIFYPVPDWYREWLKENPKLEFSEDNKSAQLRDTEVHIIFEHALADWCSEIFTDEWTATNEHPSPEHLIINTELDEWLNYKLYFVGSPEAMGKFRERFGLSIDHIRNMHIVHITEGSSIVDDYGYYYVDADCAGINVLSILQQLKCCTKLELLNDNSDLHDVLVRYVDASYLGEANTKRLFCGKPRTTTAQYATVWHNGYYIFVHVSSHLATVKLINHGFPIKDDENESSLPGIPAHIIDGFDIKEQLELLAGRSETLTYAQWKRTKEFIRRGLYGK